VAQGFERLSTKKGIAPVPELKESKAQRIERLKRAKNPWDHLDEIRSFARDGYSSIPHEWFSTYFRPWGIYTQGDGLGVVGGANGEGKAVPFFMVRIRVPNGLLTSHQVREIAALSSEHGKGVADITVRQNIQLHWVKIESIPAVLERLRAIGLTTTGACGDVARNITGCPLAGVHSHELADVSATVLALDRELGGNPEFYNLPRKYKISVTACPDWCSYPEINDIGLTAVLRPGTASRGVGGSPSAAGSGNGTGDRSFSLFRVSRGSDVQPLCTNPALDPEEPGPLATSHATSPHELGFSLRVGGGLSTQPHLALRLNVFVKPQQVVRVVRAITELFRESEVLRQSREKARLKFLFLEHGWSADSFLAALHERLGFNLDPAEPEQRPSRVHRDHLGVIPQKQPGRFSVGASVVRGRITPAQLTLAADLADRYGDGHIRNTAMQNLLLINIPESNVHHVVRELNAAGLPVVSNSFIRGTVACTGSEFCKLALTETKSFARWLTEQLEERFPNYAEDLRLHITGCPNSCGQHWIADIGIEGKKIKLNGQMVDAYYFCVGGSVGQIASIARPIGYRCAAQDVPDAIARLLDHFHAHRNDDEPLQRFLTRQSTPVLRHVLAAGPCDIAERDLAVASTPHSVEDR
jgi:sulfite reductase (ferredoxin)